MKILKEMYYKIIYKLGKMKKQYYYIDEWLCSDTEYLIYKNKYFRMWYEIRDIGIEEINKCDMPKYSMRRDYFENVYYYDNNDKEIIDKRIISGLNEYNDESYKLKMRLDNI